MQELPQTRDLEIFVTVVDDEGFAEAGRRFGVAASTVSRAVTRLEAQLGVQLLRRSTRQIELTPEGRDMLQEAREIIRRAETLVDIAQKSRAPKGPLRVNAPVPYLIHRIVPRLHEFHQAYPDIQVTLEMTDNVVDLIEAGADVAIRFGPLSDSDLLRRRLGRTHWRLVAAPSYLAEMGMPSRPTDLSEFHQVRFVSPEHINEMRFTGLPEPVKPIASVRAGNGEAVRQLVLNGMGIARFSDFMVENDLNEGRLVELFPGQLDAAPLEINAVFMTRSSGLRRLSVFLDWLATISPDDR